MFKEQFDKETLSLEDINYLYETIFDIKRSIMSNQCFVVLNETKSKKINGTKIKSSELWKNIFPIIRIKGGFIDIKGQDILR